MRRVRRAAVACTIVASLTAAAMAQSVPVPKPAPQPKTGTAAPPPAGAQSPAASTPLSLMPVPKPVVPADKPAAAMVVPPGGTIAFDANQRTLVERVNAYLTGVQTLVGDFVQVAPDGGRTEGKFYLQKPGRVRFEYDPPSPVELIADGQSMVVRDRKLATQDLYPLSQTPLRFLLADRIDLLKDTNLVGVYADSLFVTVVIEERQILGGTHRLMLMFSAKDFELKQWTVTDPQGYDTTIAVFNLDKTKKPDPDLFKINYERMLQ
jgi:outer membrane lipoprotein-sorting protein